MFSYSHTPRDFPPNKNSDTRFSPANSPWVYCGSVLQIKVPITAPSHPPIHLASVSLVRQFAAPFLYQFIIKDITEGTEEEMHTGGGRERSVKRLCPRGHSTRQAAHTVVGYVEAFRTHSFWIFNTDMMGYIIAQW